MFLKNPKASTDPRVRSLLQKAVRRGYMQVVELAVSRLEASQDSSWLRSRAIVITFEECWYLAGSLAIDRSPPSKRKALLSATNVAKQKDAAALGALAHAHREGDDSMLNSVPDQRALRIVSAALERPKAFFDWLRAQERRPDAREVILSAERYLAAATWPWDKACILAGALLATMDAMPRMEPVAGPLDEFPYWIALDKHTMQGKSALAIVAKRTNSLYRQLIWASFYCESARVNRLLPSLWWDAERSWRLRRAGLSLDAAEELWLKAKPLMNESLRVEAASLKDLIENQRPQARSHQGRLL